MCGILAEFNVKTTNTKKTPKANQFIITQYQNQYLRGTEGFGIIRINEKQEIEIDRACEPTKFLLDLYLKESSMIIAHHRRPTSTKNKLPQTHPIVISNKQLKKDYLIVHNGIISNDEELHKKHESLGFTYTTDCIEGDYVKTPKWDDSESLAIELALFIEKKITKIRIDNNAAYIILQLNKKTKKAEKVLFGKNSTLGDLNIDKVKGSIKISSEGIGEEVEKDKLFSFKITDKNQKITNIPIIFEKEEEKPTTKTPYPAFYKNAEPTLLSPYQKNIEKTLKENTTEPTTIEETRPYRAWITPENESVIDYQMLSTTSISAHHIMESCKEIKEKIKTADMLEITPIINDLLEEQIMIVYDLVNEYRTLLVIDMMTKEDTEWYSHKVETILRTMLHITAIAEKDYEKKEKQKELDELDEYEIQVSKDRDDISEENITKKEKTLGFHSDF